jgi:hypothetical protein
LVQVCLGELKLKVIKNSYEFRVASFEEYRTSGSRLETQSLKPKNMKWYIAKIVFKISCGSKPQFDEHLKLIEANNFEEAFLKARVIGLNEEDTFLNDHNKPVKWEFINVADLYPLSDLKDGVEIYSSIHEEDEANTYIHNVHQKAAFMQLRERPAF